jgi:hypothetical protein
MLEYEDYPSATGAVTKEEIYIVKSCRTCGTVFDNVFEEADHLLDSDELFDPMYVLTGSVRIGLGTLMRRFYNESEDPEKVRNTAQEVYSLLLLAEFDAKNVRPTIEMLGEK